MKILVTGGAGYIGSHTVKVLLDKGYEVVIFDKKHPSKILNCSFVEGDLNNPKLLDRTFQENSFFAVIHFAGFIEAGESMINPGKFFENNLLGGINLLNVMVKHNVKKMIFSSSAAVYSSANPVVTKKVDLREDDHKVPATVYGETKLMFEKMLYWYDKIHKIKYVSLRYFNAAGAAFGLGEDHFPETHLIPLILETILGKRESISIFGTNYETADGTCIRDYVHVVDLAQAHLLALEKLGAESRVYNVGTGKGYSVREVINLAKEITGREFSVVESERRKGDPPCLVASADKIKQELGWEPQYDLKEIVRTAWEWHLNNQANKENKNSSINSEDH